MAVPWHGARLLGGGKARFAVWAPGRKSVSVRITAPYEKTVPLHKDDDGFFKGVVGTVEAGVRYLYRLDDSLDLPDPASLSQPEGVFGPSEVVDPAFPWGADYWMGLPLSDYVLYELHVGTFTGAGTFDAAVLELSRLRDLGVTAVEVMPVAQFSGTRNWGYDGVFPSAAQNSYGGPDAFRRFVDACHKRGLAVVLDVVYNHLGPEGCRVAEYGRYHDPAFLTPWGPALNFDGQDSDPVRAFFIQSALWWLDDCRVDALRLDATSTIPDLSERPFVSELAEAVTALGRRTNRLVYLMAEHLRNDARVVRPREMGGWGLDAQWGDDLHHALHGLLTGERNGYYADYRGLPDLAKAYADGWTYDGSRVNAWRGRTLGTPGAPLAGRKFVAYWQNHDQVGNRCDGARAASLVSLEAHKLGLGAVLLSPYVPMLFMGDEYGETRPFHFFVDFSDASLNEAVRKGRLEEMRRFGWAGEPPDPSADETFKACKLDAGRRDGHGGVQMCAFVRELLRLRREHPAFKEPGKERMKVSVDEAAQLLLIQRGDGKGLFLLHFGAQPFAGPAPVPAGRWRRLLDSADERWGGAGAASPGVLASAGEALLKLGAKSFAVYESMGA